MKKIYTYSYGVATMSRLLKSIGLFCKRALEKRLYSAEETCNFEEPTKRCHPICISYAYPLYLLLYAPLCILQYILQFLLETLAVYVDKKKPKHTPMVWQR